jgi:small redox-active disulfide protein 2
MSRDDYTKIRVGDNFIGCIGLNRAMEQISQTYAGMKDEEIEETLLQLMEKGNYIPNSVRKLYGQAFVREFHRSFGQTIEPEQECTLRLTILGPGCYQCDRLEQLVLKCLSRLGLPASVEHVTDIKEISKLGLFITPALLMNGKPVISGMVPSEKKVYEIISDTAKSLGIQNQY